MNYDVSRKYISAKVAEKKGGEGRRARVMRRRRDKGRENTPETGEGETNRVEEYDVTRNRRKEGKLA